jgi:hypothetical protein
MLRIRVSWLQIAILLTVAQGDLSLSGKVYRLAENPRGLLRRVEAR